MISKGFVFIISMVVVLAVVAIGGFVINDMSERAIHAESISFEKHLKEEYSQVGFASTLEIDLMVPSPVDKVCLADRDEAGLRDIQHDLLEKYVQEGSNVFLLKKREIIHHFRLENMKTIQAVKCFETDLGRFKVLAKGAPNGKVWLE